MASTLFVDGTTPVVASWLNDVNNAVYNGAFPVSPTFVNLTSSGTLTVGGAATFDSTLTTVGNATIGGTLTSTGAATFPSLTIGSTLLSGNSGSSLIGYLANGTGAVQTTVSAKLLQELSVFDFMTATQIAAVQANTFIVDVTTAINTALTAASTLSIARLRFPSGGYLISGTLNRPAGVYMVGDGPEFTTIQAASTFNGNIIACTGSSGNVLNRGGVQNLCIIGTWATNNANTASVGISESFTNRAIHRDVRIHGCYIGMYGVGVWQIIWDNIQVDGQGTQQNNYGFWLDQLPTTYPTGTSNAVKAINCVAQYTGTAGFKLLNPNGSFFVSCEAMNGVVGWDIGNTSAGCYPCEFAQFANCTADTNSGNGWQIQQGSNATSPTYIQLANCWASTHGQYGVYLNGCKYINISNMQSGNNTQGAILFSQSQYCSLIGGEFQGNNTGNLSTNPDIWLAGGGYHTIVGNTSNMANSTAVSLLESSSTNNNIISKNNLFQGATLIGANTKATDNQGYNPVGTSGPFTVGASPATITAGQSSETHYLSQSATFTATVTKGGGHALGTLSSGTTLVVQLDPGASYLVTWTTTAPTYTKDVH